MDFLSSGPLDINLLNEYFRKDLDRIFNEASKPSLIIWGYKEKFQIYSIYSIEALTKNKISNVTFDDINSLTKTRDRKSIIFFIESSVNMIDTVSEVIDRDLCSEYHLVVVPHHLPCHLEYIVQKGLRSKLSSINSFKCFGIPLENDLISLENPNFLLDMSELDTMYKLAKTIMILQNLFGVIPSITGKGEKVQDLLKILKIMQNSISDSGEYLKESKISQMLIFDRRVDMLTPLLSQITYESLLDELFHLNSGFVMLPSFFLKDNVPRTDITIYQLNSADSFYGEIRDLPIYEALNHIIGFSQEVKAEREKYLKAKKVDELVEVTRNLKSFLVRESNAQFHLTMGMSINKYTKLSNHTDFVKYQSNFLSQEELDKAHPYVEECLLKKLEIEKIIQLICIQSFCAGGLKPKLLNWYKKEIVRTYGLASVAILTRLEKMNLLVQQQSSGMMKNLGETVFDTLTRSLNMLPDADSLCNIYAGYVPVITRLVQYHLRGGWSGIGKALSLLPGPEVTIPDNRLATAGADFSDENSSLGATFGMFKHGSTTCDLDGVLAGAQPDDRKKVVLVVFIGGVTRSEISTLRLLSQEEDLNTSFVILTTGILNLPGYLEKLAQPYDTTPTSKASNPFAV